MCRKIVIYGLLLSVFFFTIPVIKAQDPARIDSLENLLRTRNRKARFDILIALSSELARIDKSRSYEMADEAISLARRMHDTQLEVSGYFNKGYCFELNYEDSIAGIVYESALSISEDENYPDGKAEALFRIGRSLAYRQDLKGSEEYLKSALRLSREIRNFRVEGQVLATLADNLRQSGNTDSALTCYQESMVASGKADDIVTMGGVYSSLGGIYYARGNFHEAIQHYEESRRLRMQMGNRLRTAQTENNIANSYFNLARYDMAIEYYQKALPVFEEFRNSTGIASIYNGMAVIYFEQKLYDKSLENHFKKLAISRETGNMREVGNTLNNIGNVYEKMTYDSLSEKLGQDLENIIIREKTDKFLELYSKALDYYNQSLQIRKELNDRPGLLTTLGNIGVAYLHSGKLDIAMEYLDQARNLSIELNNTRELALSLMRIGQVCYWKGQYDLSVRFLNQGLTYAEKEDLKSLMVDIYQTLSVIYEKKNNYFQSLAYYKLFTAIRDSITKKETLNMMTEMQVKFETENILKANQLLLVQSELNESRVQQQKIVIWLFVIVLSLVTGILLFLFFRNLLRRKRSYDAASINPGSAYWFQRISGRLEKLFHWIF